MKVINITNKSTRIWAVATCMMALTSASALAASGTWVGSADATWANTANWSAAPVPGTGDTATFNAAATYQTIDLGGGVTVSNLTFDTSSAGAYTIGSGAAGSQALTLGQANGGVAMSSTVGNNQTLNANLGLATTGTYRLLNDSAATLTLAGTNSATSSGIKVIKVDGAGNTAITGPMISGAGSLNLEKTNSGTLTLSGGATWSGNGVNCYLPGSTLVPADLRQGTTIITGGTYTNNGEFVIGGVIANGGAGNNVKLTMNGGSLGVGGYLSLGRGNGIGGVSSDLELNNSASLLAQNLSAGFNGNAANLPQGSITLSNSSSFTVLGNGVFYIGESPGANMTMTLNGTSQLSVAGTGGHRVGGAGNGILNINDSATASFGQTSGTGNLAVDVPYRAGTGTINLNGGTLTVAGMNIARSGAGTDAAVGAVNVNGGTLVANQDFIVGMGGTQIGKLVINGGTMNMATTATKWLMVGSYDSVTGQVDIVSGNLNLNMGTAIKVARQSGRTGPAIINQSGGNVTFYSDYASTIGGGGDLDMQYAGSASSVATYNLDGGILTVPKVDSTATTGTRIFNFNGGTLKPTASSATFFNLGSGNAFANVRAGGAVIDSGANNITIVSKLQHSTIGGDPDPDGGLTKTGTGTLTLGGGYSYTGPNKVLGGTLILNTSGTVPSSGGDLVVSNATLTLTTTSGTAMPAANVSLQGSNILNLALNNTPDSAATCINASGTLSNTGTNFINISGSGLTYGVYHLLVTSSSASTNNFVLGTLPAGIKGVLTNSTSTSLDFLVTIAGQDLSWYGYDGSGYATAWDIGTTTDWTPVQGGPFVAYNQYLGNTVGDRVTFGVDGTSPTATNYVNLTTTVVPASVTFNWIYPYVLTGAGSIGGVTSLVVTDTPSVYLLNSNSYTGGTFIYGGTLAITNDHALGATAGAVTLSGGSLLVGDGASIPRNFSQTANSSIGTTSVSGDNSGTLSGNISGSGSLTKVGNGALTLSGNVTNTALINNGTGGTLTLSGNAVNSGTSQFLNGTGVISGTLTVGGELWVGNGSGVSSVVNVNTGATVTATSWIPVGRNSANGVLNVNGGTLVKGGDNSTHLTMGGVGSGQTGIINLNSGLIQDATGDCWLGEDNTAIVNQNGGLLANTGGAVYLGRTATANSTYNLNGGTLQTRSILGYAGSASVFNFNGGKLQSVADNATFIQGLTHAYVTTNGAVIDAASNVTLPQALENDPVSGPGKLVKLGAGVLTLSGSNTFTGPITVSEGGLFVTPANQGGNAVIVADNAAFGAIEGSTVNMGNLALSNSTLVITLTRGTNPVAPVLNVGALTANGTVNVALKGTVSVGTMIPLVSFASIGGSGTFNPVVTGPSQGFVGTLATNGNTLVVNVTSVGGIVWDGRNPAPGLTNLWDLNTTTNWLANGTPTDYQEATNLPPGDAVTFNDVGTGIVLLSNTVSPKSVTISNSTVNYVLQGSGQINSALGLTKLGTGMATLNVPGTYSGSTVISNGTISLGTNQTFANLSGSASVTTASGSPMLTANNTADTVFAGTIQGALGLTKTGNATLTLTSGNSFTGVATVSAGALELQNANAVAGSALTLSSGGTLSLRADADATFTNASFTMITGGTNNIQVNRLTGAGNNRTLTIANNAALGNGATAINVTSTNGDTLAFGSSFGVSGNGSSAWGGPETAFNLSGANVILNGMSTTDGGMSVSSATGNSLTVNGNVSCFVARTIYAKVNSGVLTLNDTFTGPFSGANWGFTAILNGGTLNLNNANAINGNAATSGHGSALATLQISGGTLDNSSGTNLTLNNPTVAINGAGSFTFQGSTNLNLGTGAVAMNTSGQITVAANTLTIGGAIADGGSGYGLTKDGSGTLTLSGVNTYTGATVVNAGTLAGTGTIAGAVTVNSGATLAPGGNFNAMTITGNLTLTAGSTNTFNVNGSTPANDAIALGGSVTYDGVLNVVPTGTFSAGQTFTLFSGAGAASASNFASVQSMNPAVTFSFTNGVLTVASVSVGPGGPEYLTNSYSASTHTLSLAWPAGEGWRLQMQTNSLSKGLGTNWQYITDGSVSGTNITVDPTVPTVFYRLTYP